MNRPSLRIVTLGCVLCLPISVTRINAASETMASNPTHLVRLEHPATLSFSELVALSSQDPAPADIESHLSRILTEPFVSNEAALLGAKPMRPRVSGLGVIIRAVEWNINHGLNTNEIKLALSGSKQFEEEARAHGFANAKEAARIRDQLNALSTADIVILDEVDMGVKRTHYRDITRELAKALHMNYAFGVEFVELNRIYLGVKKLDSIAAGLEHNPSEVFGVDPKRCRGLDGNAVLSRYPIRSARIVRLPECYDWYHGERQQVSDLERAKRWSAERIFEESVHRQVRRGGRMALIVDLAVPESQTGTLTVVAPHLENYCQPRCRQQQIRFLLDQIAGSRNPVVLGGDLNTTGEDGTPTSIRHEILKRIRNYKFWAREAVLWFVPVPFYSVIDYPVNYMKNYHDPTALNMHLFAPNASKPLFREAQAFRFNDGGSFDFNGRPGRSFHRKGRTLANSNERGWKGFAVTFSFRRPIPFFGEFKLDWFFVKPAPGDPAGDEPVQFSPYRGRTMQEVNTALGGRLSDHSPISVDLPSSGISRRFRH
jgi:endonuclease/exonuclease/phosphatase family metal-dependent hydrolase